MPIESILLALLYGAAPGLPGSFSLDFSGVMDGAESMVNGLFPVFTPVIGWQLGFGLLFAILGIIGGVVMTLSRRR